MSRDVRQGQKGANKEKPGGGDSLDDCEPGDNIQTADPEEFYQRRRGFIRRRIAGELIV